MCVYVCVRSIQSIEMEMDCSFSYKTLHQIYGHFITKTVKEHLQCSVKTFITKPVKEHLQCSVKTFITKPVKEHLQCSVKTFITKPVKEHLKCTVKTVKEHLQCLVNCLVEIIEYKRVFCATKSLHAFFKVLF